MKQSAVFPVNEPTYVVMRLSDWPLCSYIIFSDPIHSDWNILWQVVHRLCYLSFHDNPCSVCFVLLYQLLKLRNGEWDDVNVYREWWIGMDVVGKRSWLVWTVCWLYGVSHYTSVSKSFRTESITKYTLTTTNTGWEATRRVTAAKLTSLTHKIAI
jgi:hypothetical protein